jgi:predicted Rossmann fold nucleotide-binding protein DprA/Smf involved in DNA uptake
MTKKNIRPNGCPVSLTPGDGQYPVILVDRLQSSAPEKISALGNLEVLQKPKTALFCSSRCPGNAILVAYESAQRMRDAGGTVISGFHSPVEKECLRILLRGQQPIIICPARSLQAMRLPLEWKEGIDLGRLLILSPFAPWLRRATTTLAHVRNQFASALADEVFMPYASPGGRLEQITKQMREWRIPVHDKI